MTKRKLYYALAPIYHHPEGKSIDIAVPLISPDDERYP